MNALPTTQNEVFMLSHNEFFEEDGDITDNEFDEQYQFEVNESVLKSTESIYMNLQDEKDKIKIISLADKTDIQSNNESVYMGRKDEEETNTINQTSTCESIFIANIPKTRQSNKSKSSAQSSPQTTGSNINNQPAAISSTQTTSSNINNDPAAKSSPQTTTPSYNKDNAPRSSNNIEIEEQTIEDKTQPDIYEDLALLKYIKTNTLEPGLSKKAVRRIKDQSKRYKFDENILYFTPNDKIKLIIPPIEERINIVECAHLLGHFQVRSTYDRIKERYYWKNMIKTVERVINQCQPCRRHEIEAEIHPPARAISVGNINDRIAIDLVFGVP
jgi:hypothetical protein